MACKKFCKCMKVNQAAALICATCLEWEEKKKKK
jgi:hypothetical protein